MTLVAQTVVQTAQWLAETKPDQGRLASGFADSFWVVLALAAAVFVLGASLIRRLRRSSYRTEIRAELEAEIAERDAGEAGAPAADGGVAERDPGAGPSQERRPGEQG